MIRAALGRLIKDKQCVFKRFQSHYYAHLLLVRPSPYVVTFKINYFVYFSSSRDYIGGQAR